MTFRLPFVIVRRVWSVVLASIWMAPLAWSATVAEPELKAAIVYNLLLFTEWPPEHQPNVASPLILCIRAGSDLVTPLERLAARGMAGVPIELRQLGNSTELRRCHAVFADGSNTHRIELRRRVASGGATVWIADETEIAAVDVGIQLLRNGAKLAFEVNLIALRQAGVQVSSKLLRLARAVRQ